MPSADAYNKSLTAAICLITLYGLFGCANPRIELVSGVVTAGGEVVPVSEVHLKDIVYVYTHVRWSPATEPGGRREVGWLWYSTGDQLVHADRQVLNFKETPARLVSYLPAAGLGVGHYRVTTLIDGIVIDTQQFSVVP
jgi:hypothetical protein